MFGIDTTRYQIIDLSYTVDPDNCPLDRPFKLTLGYLADNAFKNDVQTHSHVGTHVEAPAHFYENGKDVTAYSLDAFYGRAILLDVKDASQATQIDGNYLQQQIGDIIRPGDIVICRNSDKESQKAGGNSLPSFTPDGAQWLAEYGIKMLGIDNYFRLGKDIPDGRELHDILMSRDVTLIEWLDNLDALSQRVFFFMALPFKVQKMDSSWARAIAIEDIK